MKRVRATTLIAALLSLGAARPERAGPVELLQPGARAADSSALIESDMNRYQRVRWRVRSGKFAAALEELAFVDDPRSKELFFDRYSVLRGQAHQGLGRFEAAKADYLRAIYTSQVPAVNEAAVRGLIAVTKKLGRRAEERAYLDALIQRPGSELEPELCLQRVEVLIALGESALARREAWALIDHYPEPKAVESALRSVARIDRRRRAPAAERMADRVRVGLARAKYLARNHRFGRAVRELKTLRRSARTSELALAVELELASVLRENEKRSQAEEVLNAALENPRYQPARAKVLLPLAHLARDRYQYPRARALYGELLQNYPGTEEARLAAQHAVQLEYDAREYAAASDRALEAPLFGEGLWLAGWSSYLAGRYAAADEYFRKLSSEKSAELDPELRDAAEYWLIRSAEKSGRHEDAVRSYRALVAKKPIEYYGLLARARLEFLGEPYFQPSPPIEAPPANVEEVVALLGPDRPAGVDRGIALLRAGLRGEGAEELLAVLDEYRRTGHLLGATLTVELFCLFDREAWVFLLSRNIAAGEGARLDRRPEFWRILHYAYPTLFESEVGAASRKHEIDPLLVYAVMRTESLFRPDAVSKVGARGLMQLMPYTARWIGRSTPEARRHAGRYRAPESNVWLGAWYMKSLLGRYEGNVVRALGAYNAGPAAMDRWVRDHRALDADEIAERTPYDETRRYIRRALTSYLMYRRLYGGGTVSLGG